MRAFSAARVNSTIAVKCGQRETEWPVLRVKARDKFVGDDKDAIAQAVVKHARTKHGHTLDPDVVLSHLEGVRPHERDA